MAEPLNAAKAPNVSQTAAAKNAPQEELGGWIERITFSNEENGWTVMAVKVAGRKQLATVVGHLPGASVGEFIDLKGHWGQNPKYGPQFHAQSYELKPPSSAASLKKYLGSGLIKGLGPVLAGRLVDQFGSQTFDILDNYPGRLTEVEGLGAARREMIIAAWSRTQGLKRLLTFLAEFGLGPAIGLKIMRRLGDGADSLIREDPYRLAYEIDGVGFATADKVARHLGLSPDAPQRLAAGILYTLTEEASEGHLYIPESTLLKKVIELIPEAEVEALQDALTHLVLESKVKGERPAEPGGDLDIYLPRLLKAENWVAQELTTLNQTPAILDVPRHEAALAWAEKSLNLTLSPSQKEAAKLALEHKVLIITGGPGTGKTTITKVICAIFGAMKARLTLAAPTGRAAKRLGEATGWTAKTIHRLLEYAPQGGGFMRGPKNKLETDFLLLDEASMLDITLANQLFGAMPPRARLVVVGDIDQLPSVGPGRVLADLIESRAFPVARLNEIHRQAEESQIIRAAHQVNQGLMPESSQDRDHGDFYFIEENDPKQVLEKIVFLAGKRLPEKLGLNSLEDVQVLTPMRSRDLGTDQLNQILSDRLNHDQGPTVSRFGRRFRQGDRVMQVRNNYQREVFNGDSGSVTKIDPETQELCVNFDGQEVIYDFADLDELVLAYAVTIHKSQGSEFPVVIVPLYSGHQIMLRRKLLYTAITRGRRFVVLIGSVDALKKALAKSQEHTRYSHLADKLSGHW